MRLFTEAVAGGMGADKLRLHTHLVTRQGDWGPYTTHPLTSLNDLHHHHKLLTDPKTYAELHVGIGGPLAIKGANERTDGGVSPSQHDFHTHVFLRKEKNSDTFIPAYMYTDEQHRRKGWGETIWDHLHKKITKAGLDLDHDWTGQTGPGFAWSRKTAGKDHNWKMPARHDLENRLDRKSEWHHLTDRQKSDFLLAATGATRLGKGEFNDPKKRHSKGLVGNTEVGLVRAHMKKAHGINMHPFSVADTMHHMTGERGPYSYVSGYHGTPLDKLRSSFDAERQRRRMAQKPDSVLQRVPYAGHPGEDRPPARRVRKRVSGRVYDRRRTPLVWEFSKEKEKV